MKYGTFYYGTYPVTTFGGLRESLGLWLIKDETSLPDAIRGQIINMAIGELASLELRFNEYTASISALAGVSTSDLPTGFSKPYQMFYYSSGVKYDVNYLDREEFLTKYPDSTETGDISHYSIWAGKILWGPTPAANCDVSFDIFRVLPDLVDANSFNDFTVNAWPLILFKSCCLAALFGYEDARIPVWQQKCTALENKLVIDHARARSSGRRPASRDYGYTGA